jgi:uncharacterized membrane protein YgcG
MKKVIVLLIGGAIAILLSCNSYKQVHQNREAFYGNKEVTDAFSRYQVYLHDRNGIYSVENPQLSEKGISGRAQMLSDSAAVEILKVPSSARQKKLHRNDLHVYTNSSILEETSLSASANNQLSEQQIQKEALLLLKKEDITGVKLNAVDKKNNFTSAGSGLIVALSVVLTIILISAAISAGSRSASNSSGGSGSNSGNSNSGGSNSGGSNSGASNSGGSCYVATMVYKNYDAPEVMVLRRFRDEVLATSVAGRYFIKNYYKYSPLFVERFKNNQKINQLLKHILDKWVQHLSKR